MAKKKKTTRKKTVQAAPAPAAPKADNQIKPSKRDLPAKKAPAKKTPAKKASDNGPGFWQKTRQFFREVRVELNKVTWPSRKETMASTSVVLVLVFIVAVYLGLVDIALSRALKLLF